MTAVHLSKQQALDADPKAIQQINFTANLDRAGNTRIYFILGEAKERISWQTTCPLLKTGLPLTKNVIKPLAKSVLIPLGLTAAASAVDAEIHKKNLRIWPLYFTS